MEVYLLQITQKIADGEPLIVTLLISAIAVLGGAVTWLALYIKKLHNRSLQLTEKVIETMTQVESTIQINIKTIELTSLTQVRAIDNFSNTLNDLHKDILRATNNLKP